MKKYLNWISNHSIQTLNVFQTVLKQNRAGKKIQTSRRMKAPQQCGKFFAQNLVTCNWTQPFDTFFCRYADLFVCYGGEPIDCIRVEFHGMKCLTAKNDIYLFDWLVQSCFRLVLFIFIWWLLALFLNSRYANTIPKMTNQFECDFIRKNFNFNRCCQNIYSVDAFKQCRFNWYYVSYVIYYIHSICFTNSLRTFRSNRKYGQWVFT